MTLKEKKQKLIALGEEKKNLEQEEKNILNRKYDVAVEIEELQDSIDLERYNSYINKCYSTIFVMNSQKDKINKNFIKIDSIELYKEINNEKVRISYTEVKIAIKNNDISSFNVCYKTREKSTIKELVNNRNKISIEDFNKELDKLNRHIKKIQQSSYKGN